MKGIAIWMRPSHNGDYYMGELLCEEIVHSTNKYIPTPELKTRIGWQVERWLIRKSLVRWYNRYCHRPVPDSPEDKAMDELPEFVNNATTLSNYLFYSNLEYLAIRMQGVMKSLRIISRRDYHLLVFLEHEAQERQKQVAR
jgi:hypothetical protein